jgi:hypothetical protein
MIHGKARLQWTIFFCKIMWKWNHFVNSLFLVNREKSASVQRWYFTSGSYELNLFPILLTFRFVQLLAIQKSMLMPRLLSIQGGRAMPWWLMITATTSNSLLDVLFNGVTVCRCWRIWSPGMPWRHHTCCCLGKETSNYWKWQSVNSSRAKQFCRHCTTYNSNVDGRKALQFYSFQL